MGVKARPTASKPTPPPAQAPRLLGDIKKSTPGTADSKDGQLSLLSPCLSRGKGLGTDEGEGAISLGGGGGSGPGDRRGSVETYQKVILRESESESESERERN